MSQVASRRGYLTDSLPKASRSAAILAPTISPNSGYLQTRGSSVACGKRARADTLAQLGPCGESERLGAPEHRVTHGDYSTGRVGGGWHLADVETASIMTTRSDCEDKNKKKRLPEATEAADATPRRR